MQYRRPPGPVLALLCLAAATGSAVGACTSDEAAVPAVVDAPDAAPNAAPDAASSVSDPSPDAAAADATADASPKSQDASTLDGSVLDAAVVDAAKPFVDGGLGIGTVTLATPATACAPGTWCVEPAAVMAGFSELHGALSASGPDDIWWAGSRLSSPDDASIVHLSGGQWQRIKVPGGYDFTAIWAQAPNNVWAGRPFGPIHHYDGSSWTIQGSLNGTRAVRAIWGASANDFWASYEGGVIAHHVAGVWTAMTVPGNAAETDYYALSGTSTSNVWATGEAGTVQHWNGATWTQVPSATTENLTGVYVAGPSAIFAVPFTRFEPPRRYDGATWTPLTLPATPALWLRAAGGRSANDVWVVDEAGAVRQWNGSAWTVSQPTTERLRSVYAAPTGDVWVAGGKVIAHRAP